MKIGHFDYKKSCHRRTSVDLDIFSGCREEMLGSTDFDLLAVFSRFIRACPQMSLFAVVSKLFLTVT